VIKRLPSHPALVWCVRLVLAAVLIYAALQKIWMPLEFARLIREYHILPEQLLNLAAVILPWLELVCGCCFVTGFGLMGTSFLLSALNGVFVVAIIYRAWLIMQATGVAFFDLSFDCGCGFGVVYIPTKIVENLLMVAAGLFILFARLRPRSGT
jgi:uncharacterized membrane protein YphA (DoxX/SURF4 family)